MGHLPLCLQKAKCKNCKMRTPEGRCIALSVTNFAGPCPFYKRGNFYEHVDAYKIARKEYGGVHFDEEI